MWTVSDVSGEESEDRVSESVLSIAQRPTSMHHLTQTTLTCRHLHAVVVVHETAHDVKRGDQLCKVSTTLLQSVT